MKYTQDELRKMLLGITWDDFINHNGAYKVDGVCFIAKFGLHLGQPVIAIVADDQFVIIKRVKCKPYQTYNSLFFTVSPVNTQTQLQQALCCTVMEMYVADELLLGRKYVVGPVPPNWHTKRRQIEQNLRQKGMTLRKHSSYLDLKDTYGKQGKYKW